MKLGDYFSPDYKKKLATSTLKPGTVFITQDKIAGKEKWHIIVSINENELAVATVRINSTKNTNVYRDNHKLSNNYHIKKSDCDFLKHDSFVDCNHLIPWNKKNVHTVLCDHSAYLGDVNEKTLDNIRSTIAMARTIPTKVKRKFQLL